MIYEIYPYVLPHIILGELFVWLKLFGIEPGTFAVADEDCTCRPELQLPNIRKSFVSDRKRLISMWIMSTSERCCVKH